MRIMARDDHVNADLIRTLNRMLSSQPVILSEIAESIGGEEYEDLEDGVQYPVSGFYVNPSTEVLEVFVVTPERLCIYQRNKASDSLSITLNLSRVKRVVEQRTGGVLSVTIELDADVTPIFLESEFAIEPRITEGRVQPDHQIGRMIAQGAIRPTTYVLSPVSQSGPAAEDNLKTFARALRNAIGF